MSATSAASDASTCRLSNTNNNANDWDYLVPSSNPVTKKPSSVRDPTLGAELQRRDTESKTNNLINLPGVPPLEHPSSKPSGMGNEWFCDPNKTVIYYKRGTRVHHRHRATTANSELQESKLRIMANRHLRSHNLREVLGVQEIVDIKPTPSVGTTATSGILNAVTMNRQEIEALISERNELYEILRMNEADASARYANEKTLVSIKQDSVAEQQRLRQQISALEEELEVSLCQINRLNAERNKCTQQLEELQTIRDELEHKIQVTIQRHQRELQQLESSCEKHHQTVLAEKSQEWEENRKRLDLELKTKTEECAKREVEMKQTLADMRLQLDKLKDECEHLQKESSMQQNEHREELAQCVKHYEMLTEARNSDRNKELMELKQTHCKELKDSVHEMKTAKRQALSEMKMCYVDRIDALQESLSLCTKENNVFRDKLFQIEQQQQQQQQQRDRWEQKQKEHKQSQTTQLANDFDDRWIQKMCETVRAEFGDWDRENCGLWEARFAELRNEADCVADKLRAELQIEQEAVYRAKEETNQILKKFDEYQTGAEQKLQTLQREMEQLKATHELELTKIEASHQEKIALAEVYQALDTRKLLDEKLQHFHTRCDEQLEKERADLRDQLQQALYHAFIQIDKWMRDWAESVECTIQIIKAAEHSSADDNASKMKEMRLEELRRTASAQCAFPFDSNLSDTDWKKGLVSDFMNQLQDCLGPQLRSTLDRLLTEYHTAMGHVRKRVEYDITKFKKKYEEDLEKCQQSQLQEYQNKLTQVREELTSRIQAKEDELQKMQSKRDEWKEATSEKLRNKIEKQYKREFEQKCKEQFRSAEIMHTSTECLSNEHQLSTYATRAITELKARIQRLREENLSLRRLLLRRPLLSNKCEKTDEDAKAINVLAVAKSHTVSEFHSK